MPTTLHIGLTPIAKKAKLTFLKLAPDDAIYNPHGEQNPVSPYQLMAGTIIQRTLDIQPTITVRPGWPLRVIVNKDIILSPYRSGDQ